MKGKGRARNTVDRQTEPEGVHPVGEAKETNHNDACLPTASAGVRGPVKTSRRDTVNHPATGKVGLATQGSEGSSMCTEPAVLPSGGPGQIRGVHRVRKQTGEHLARLAM